MNTGPMSEAAGRPGVAHDVPFLSVVLPVRNEVDHIEAAVASVLAQEWPDDRWEVIVVDGASDDGTAELLEAIRARRSAVGARPEVHVLDNPARIVPSAMNTAIRAARGSILVRVDGHCELDAGYLRRVVEVLDETGADCVGGVVRTIGESPTARAIAAAQSSVVGVGNVAFRTGRPEAGRVDSVPFGAFPMEVFERLGGFDEELVRNQDDEFTFRILRSGGMVWFDPSIASTYHSRATLSSLWRQYHQYGVFKVRVAQKHGGFAAPRHLAPGALVAGLAASLVVGVVFRRPIVPGVLWGGYVGASGALAAREGRRRSAPLLRTAMAVWALHLGYGTGFWRGVWRFRKRFGG